jgi:hypothetical protein
MYNRPLSRADIKAIAAYLQGTEEELEIAMSKLGFDPSLYTEAELRDWLKREAGVVQCPDTGVWRLR